jgi:serine/threonine protein kinase
MTTVFRDIGAYRIVREIGHGGMATVFLAEDTRHARHVALKLVSIARDREGRDVLDAERWGAKLQAPGRSLRPGPASTRTAISRLPSRW